MNTQLNGFSVVSRTFVTGETPVQAFGILGGREDFGSTSTRSMWAGCIDAVEFIPNGKIKIVESENSIVPGSFCRAGIRA